MKYHVRYGCDKHDYVTTYTMEKARQQANHLKEKGRKTVIIAGLTIDKYGRIVYRDCP